MPPQDSSPKVVQFGVFELDLQRAELRKQGVKVKLQEQPLKVLQFLLEDPGQIISREQLRTHIWPANTFVEFDQGLYSAMGRLRDALGDSSEKPQFIETVARRGYRFIAFINAVGEPTNAVLADGSTASALPTRGEPPATKTESEAPSSTPRKLTPVLIAGLFGA